MSNNQNQGESDKNGENEDDGFMTFESRRNRRNQNSDSMQGSRGSYSSASPSSHGGYSSSSPSSRSSYSSSSPRQSFHTDRQHQNQGSRSGYLSSSPRQGMQTDRQNQGPRSGYSSSSPRQGLHTDRQNQNQGGDRGQSLHSPRRSNGESKNNGINDKELSDICKLKLFKQRRIKDFRLAGTHTCEQLRAIAEEIANELNAMRETDRREILITLLTTVLKHVAHMRTGHTEYVRLLAPLLQEFGANRKIRDVKGYGFAFKMIWPNDVSEIYDIPGWVEAVKELILILDINVLDTTNKQGETLRVAYDKAVKKGDAPESIQMRDVLAGKGTLNPEMFHKLNNDLLNKISPKTAQSFGNTMKLSWINNPQHLVELITSSMLHLHDIPEAGRMRLVTKQLESYTVAMETKISSDELAVHIPPNFYADGDQTRAFLEQLATHVGNVIPEQKRLFDQTCLDALSNGGTDWVSRSVSIGALAAIIGELSGRIGSEHFNDFVSTYLRKEKMSEDEQKLVMIPLAHALYAIKAGDGKVALSSVLSDESCKLYASCKFHMRITIHLEKALSEFAGRPFKLEQLGELVKPRKVEQHCAPQGKTSGRQSRRDQYNARNASISDNLPVVAIQSITSPDNAVSVKTSVLSLRDVIDVEKYGSIVPDCIQLGIQAKKSSTGWSDNNIDNWVYAQGKRVNQDDEIPTIIVSLFADKIRFGSATNREEEAVMFDLINRIFVEVYGESCYYTSIEKLRLVNPAELAEIFETTKSRDSFGRFLQISFD